MKIIFEAYRDFWKYSFDFRGKTNWGQYFWSFLVNFLILFIINILLGTFKGFGEPEIPLRILSWYITPLILFIPNASMTIRRLRDCGNSVVLGTLWIFGNVVYFLFLSINSSRIENITKFFLLIVGVVIFLICLKPSDISKG